MKSLDERIPPNVAEAKAVLAEFRKIAVSSEFHVLNPGAREGNSWGFDGVSSVASECALPAAAGKGNRSSV